MADFVVTTINLSAVTETLDALNKDATFLSAIKDVEVRRYDYVANSSYQTTVSFNAVAARLRELGPEAEYNVPSWYRDNENGLDVVLQDLRTLARHHDQAEGAKEGLNNLINGIEEAKKEPVEAAWGIYRRQQSVASDIAQVQRRTQTKPTTAFTDILLAFPELAQFSFAEDGRSLPTLVGSEKRDLNLSAFTVNGVKLSEHIRTQVDKLESIDIPEGALFDTADLQSATVVTNVSERRSGIPSVSYGMQHPRVAKGDNLNMVQVFTFSFNPTEPEALIPLGSTKPILLATKAPTDLMHLSGKAYTQVAIAELEKQAEAARKEGDHEKAKAAETKLAMVHSSYTLNIVVPLSVGDKELDAATRLRMGDTDGGYRGGYHMKSMGMRGAMHLESVAAMDMGDFEDDRGADEGESHSATTLAEKFEEAGLHTKVDITDAYGTQPTDGSLNQFIITAHPEEMQALMLSTMGASKKALEAESGLMVDFLSRGQAQAEDGIHVLDRIPGATSTPNPKTDPVYHTLPLAITPGLEAKRGKGKEKEDKPAERRSSERLKKKRAGVS